MARSLIPAAYRGGDGGPPDPVGQTVAGCRVEKLLGRGGMGAVYLARRDDGTPAVAKVLAPELVDNVRLRARFEREWEALRKLPPHPHLVRVEAVTQLGGSPCIVMEYVAGQSLSQELRDEGRFPCVKAASIVRQVAQAISVVHGHGVLHRDLTPGNVMLTTAGSAKVIDFGLAKDLFRSTLTTPGQMLGTAYYMSPEQLEGGSVDARSDVFALGATFYQLLTGAPPFFSKDLAEVVELINAGEFTPPSQVVAEMPLAFDELLLQMLAPEMRCRHGSMQEVIEDVDRILVGGGCSAPCLSGSGQRVPLLGARRFVLGGGPGCAMRLPGPGVAARHAQVRFERRGYVLYDLKSAEGTFVEDQPVTVQPRVLEDGDRVRLGEVELRFEDPRSRRRVEAYLQDVRRRALPLAAVEALAALGDRRATLWLLEALSAGDVSRRVASALEGITDPATRAAVTARCQAAAAQRASEAGQRLAQVTGQAGDDPAAWLDMWIKARATQPVQAVPAGDVPCLQLRTVTGQTWPMQMAVADPGVVLAGRDARCTLRLGEGGARLHATVVRLWRRLAVRDESGGAAALNDVSFSCALAEAGDGLTLGAVRFVVEEEPTQSAAGRPVDADVFDALAEVGHPAVAQALGRAAHQQVDWLPGLAAELFLWDEEARRRFQGCVRELLARRVERARGQLARLEGRRGQTPQVTPRGWL